MRKILLLLLFFCIGAVAKAQEEPVMTLTVEMNGTVPLLLEFAATEAGNNLKIDWGNGVKEDIGELKVIADPLELTTATGIPLGDGVVKIYSNGLAFFQSVWGREMPKITAVNALKAIDLQKLILTSHALVACDISKNTKLTEFTCDGNKISTLNVSANTELKVLSCKNNLLKKLDISKCTQLVKLDAQGNLLSTIDLSKHELLDNVLLLNNKLATVNVAGSDRITFFNVSNNKLTTLDLSNCTKLDRVFCANNLLTTLNVPGSITSLLNCSGNRLTLAALPIVTTKTYTCSPQQILVNYIKEGDVVDYSAQMTLTGFATEPQTTTFTWKAGKNTLEAGVDYTANQGVFTFLKAQSEKILCEMTTLAFPAFTGSKVFKTNSAEFYTFGELISLKAETTATELLSLDFAALGSGIKLQLDWGDGKRVNTEEIQVVDEYSSVTTVAGKPLGDGTIKVYGDKLAAFSVMWTKPSGELTYPKITSLDVTKATDLQELTATTQALTSIDVSGNTNLIALTCYGNPLSKLTLTNAKLEKLDCNACALTELNITKCLALKSLNAQNNSLSELNITANTGLDNLLLIGNQLSRLDCSKNLKLLTLNVNNNKLTQLDASSCPVLDRLFCMNNQLAELQAGSSLTTLSCANNQLSPATLPVISPKSYTYFPQAPLTLAASIHAEESLDLSAQTNLMGITNTEQKTLFTWKTATKTLVVNEDYVENEGVFTFLRLQEVPAYCEMTTPAFPKFTGANIFKTTPILIEKPTGINDASKNEDIQVYTDNGAVFISGLNGNEAIAIFTIQGVKVAEAKATQRYFSTPLQSGQYIIRVDKTSYKTMVK